MKNKLKVVSFDRVWCKLKKSLKNKDLYFFYEVVNIDETVGRVFKFKGDGYQYNPKYHEHWFPVSRCHWNVIFPLYLLNNRKLTGKYSIITNEKHSAIINTETNEVFDPTYFANKIEFKETIDRFKEGYKIENIIRHSVRVDFGIFSRMADNVFKKDKASIIIELERLQKEIT